MNRDQAPSTAGESLAQTEAMLSERLSVARRAARMLDPVRDRGTVWTWSLMQLVVFLAGALVCRKAADPSVFEAATLFFGVMFALLALIRYAVQADRRKLVALALQGRTTEAEITRRYDTTTRTDVTPSFSYVCVFTAQHEHGSRESLEGLLPSKSEDLFRTGDHLEVCYLPGQPRTCSEALSASQKAFLFSRQPLLIDLGFSLLTLGAAIWATGFTGEPAAAGDRTTDLVSAAIAHFQTRWSAAPQRVWLEGLLLLTAAAIALPAAWRFCTATLSTSRLSSRT